jgi:hypothetical protein
VARVRPGSSTRAVRRRLRARHQRLGGERTHDDLHRSLAGPQAAVPMAAGFGHRPRAGGRAVIAAVRNLTTTGGRRRQAMQRRVTGRPPLTGHRQASRRTTSQLDRAGTAHGRCRAGRTVPQQRARGAGGTIDPLQARRADRR